MEERGRGLLQSTIPIFAWKDYKNHEKSSRIGGSRAETWTMASLTTKKKY